ncbi:MAG: enoyl-CoA hydratase/isomerase family protein [Gammaproteobacteria bacterium]|nr:enoyl-CoA hydratase/isomerase family protein [Gammaproteobacteria bacterium]
MPYDYQLLDITIDKGVLFATINNPPINLMTIPLYMELVSFTEEVEVDDDIRVVVMQSAVPDFFIAHFDVEALLATDISEPAIRSSELNPFHLMCERMRTMPKATIAKIDGRVGGGGSEFASSCDMRFGSLEKTKINQMEVALGILPGGSGTQRLPRLVGRGRAMEIVLGSDDLDAATAEKWGYLNRALPASGLDEFVDRLAYRIAGFPGQAIALAKESVNHAELPLREGLAEEAYLFQQSLRTHGAQTRMKQYMELGGQTREVELRIGEVCLELGQE